MNTEPKQFIEVLEVIPHVAGSWPTVGTIPGETYHYPKNPNKPSRKVNFTAQISSYCQVNEGKGYRSLCVKPAQWVLDLITSSMLAIENDSISFTLRQNNPGEDYRLTAQYSQILGSRPICTIAADTVPQEA